MPRIYVSRIEQNQIRCDGAVVEIVGETRLERAVLDRTVVERYGIEHIRRESTQTALSEKTADRTVYRLN